MVEHAQTRLTITRVRVQLATQGKPVKLVNVMYKTQGPHSHILMKGGGGPSDFFGSKILAKSDFFGL